MKICVCMQGYVPIRSEANERSEMTSQILFGEYAEILNRQDDWLYIRHIYDEYRGWIDEKGVEPAESTKDAAAFLSSGQITVTDSKNEKSIVLPIGASVSGFTKAGIIANNREFLTQEISAFSKVNEKSFQELYQPLLGVSYLWGGRCGAGFDCSGFVQYLYRMMNIALPRDTGDQIKRGSLVPSLSDVKAGDLAFFDNHEGKISHVGFLIDSHKILHASGMVKINRIDPEGIISEQGKYSHKLREIKRLL